jgi:hypothetical protein
MRTRRRVLLVVAICAWPLLPGNAVARELTFEERVRAEEAIERLCYSHQLGHQPAFETVVSEESIRKRVEADLARSRLLFELRGIAISPEMLQEEVAQIETHTQFPTQLREMYDVLGHDPVLIRECLAGPRLVKRLHEQRTPVRQPLDRSPESPSKTVAAANSCNKQEGPEVPRVRCF